MKKLQHLVLTLIFSVVSTGLWSDVFIWDGGAVDNNWESPDNWDLDSGYPDNNLDDVIIPNGSGFVVEIGLPGTINLNIRDLAIGSDATINLNNSRLEAEGTTSGGGHINNIGTVGNGSDDLVLHNSLGVKVTISEADGNIGGVISELNVTDGNIYTYLSTATDTGLDLEITDLVSWIGSGALRGPDNLIANTGGNLTVGNSAGSHTLNIREKFNNMTLANGIDITTAFDLVIDGTLDAEFSTITNTSTWYGFSAYNITDLGALITDDLILGKTTAGPLLTQDGTYKIGSLTYNGASGVHIGASTLELGTNVTTCNFSSDGGTLLLSSGTFNIVDVYVPNGDPGNLWILKGGPVTSNFLNLYLLGNSAIFNTGGNGLTVNNPSASFGSVFGDGVINSTDGIIDIEGNLSLSSLSVADAGSDNPVNLVVGLDSNIANLYLNGIDFTPGQNLTTVTTEVVSSSLTIGSGKEFYVTGTFTDTGGSSTIDADGSRIVINQTGSTFNVLNLKNSSEFTITGSGVNTEIVALDLVGTTGNVINIGDGTLKVTNIVNGTPHVESSGGKLWIENAGSSYIRGDFNELITPVASNITLSGDLTISGGIGKVFKPGNFIDNGYDVFITGETTFTAGGTSNFNSITIQPGGDFTLGSDIVVSRDWSNYGIVDASTFRVTFDDQYKTSHINGSTYFYEFWCRTNSKNLVFEATKTQTIRELNLYSGANSEAITLSSSIPGTQWNIAKTALGTAECSRLLVSDSNASDQPLSADTNPPNVGASYDGGNNNGWSGFVTQNTWIGGALGKETWWNEGTNWSAGLPDSDEGLPAGRVVIPPGRTYYPKLRQNEAVGIVIISPGATVDVSTFELDTTFSFRNQGTIRFDAGGSSTRTDSDAGCVEFYGSATTTVNWNNNFHDLKINTTGTLNLDTSRTVFGSMEIDSGTFNIGANNITIVEDLTSFSSTALTASTGAVIFGFTGESGNSTINNQMELVHITLNQSIHSLTLGGQLTVSGTLTNNGTFNANSQKVIFDGLDTKLEGTSEVTFEDIDITGTSKLTLNNGIKVGGDWNNQGTFDSTTNLQGVEFISGSGASIIYGSNTFYNLICTSPGKVLKFQSGTTQTITNNLNVIGSDLGLITLEPTNYLVDNFTLSVPAATTVDYVNVSYSSISGGNDIDAQYHSLDGGGNDLADPGKWIFRKDYYLWNGSDGATDDSWFNLNNWERTSGDTVVVKPQSGDWVQIPGGLAYYPKLSHVTDPVTVTVKSLNIAVGGRLILGDSTATTFNTTYLYNNGTIEVATDAASISTMDTDSGTIEFTGAAYDLTGFATEYNNLKISGDKSLGANITVNGDFNLNSGSLTLGSYNVDLYGDFTESSSFTLTPGTSTLDIKGTSTYSGYTQLNNLIISSGGTLSLDRDISAKSYVINGTFNPGNYIVKVETTWNNGGTFNRGNSSVEFIGTGDATIIGNTTFNVLKCTQITKTLKFTAGSTQTFYDLILTGQSGVGEKVYLTGTPLATWNFLNAKGSDVQVSWVDVNWGNVDDSGSNIKAENSSFANSDTLGPDPYWWSISPNSYTWSAGAGSSDWTDENNWTPYNATHFEHDNYSIPDATTTTFDPVLPLGTTTINNLTIDTDGILDASGNTLVINGTLNNGGTIKRNVGSSISKNDNDSGTVAYETGPGIIQQYPGSGYFNLTFTSGSWSLPGDIDIYGTLNNIGATFTHNSKNVTFKGSQPSEIKGSFILNNLVIDKSGAVVSLSNDITIENDFTLNSGTFTNSNKNLTINNNFSIVDGSFNAGNLITKIGGYFSRAGGAFIHQSGTMEFFDNSKISVISGDNIFGTLKVANTEINKVIKFTAGTTQEVVDLNIAGGTNLGEQIDLYSTLNNSKWYFKVTNSATVSDVNVRDGYLSSGGINIYASGDSNDIDTTCDISVVDGTPRWYFGVLPPTTWIGNTSDWSIPTNWDNGVPTATNEAIVDAVTLPKVPPVLTAQGEAKTLTIKSGASVDLDGQNLVVENLDLQAGGLLKLRGDETTVTVSGSKTLAGTVEYKGPTAVGGSVTGLKLGNSYTNLTFSSDDTFTVNGGDLLITGTGVLTISSGTLDLASEILNINTPGNYSSSGILKISGTQNIIGLVADTVNDRIPGSVIYAGARDLPNYQKYTNLTIDAAITALNTIDVSGTLTNSSNFNIGGNTLTFGDYSGAASTMTTDGGTIVSTSAALEEIKTLAVTNGVTLTGGANGISVLDSIAGAVTVATYGTVNLNSTTITSLDINGTGPVNGIVSANGALTVGNLDIDANSSLSTGANNLSVTGTTNATSGNAGTITSGTGTQSFTGNFQIGTLYLSETSSTFSGTTVIFNTVNNNIANNALTTFTNGAAHTVTLNTASQQFNRIEKTGAGALAVNGALITEKAGLSTGDLTISAGSITTNGSLTVGGNISLVGDLTLSDSTNSVGGDVTGAGTLDATLDITDPLTVTGSLGTVATALGSLSAGNIELGGDWNVTAFTPGTSTITFTGSANYSLLDDSDIVFNNLVVAGGTLSNDHIAGGAIAAQNITTAALTLTAETAVLDTKGLSLTVSGISTGNGVISSTGGNTSLGAIDNTTTKLRATGTHTEFSASASQTIYTASLASGTDALIITNIPGANALTIVGFDNGGTGFGGSLDLDGAVTTPNVYGKFNTLDLAVNAAAGTNSADIETGAGTGFLTSITGGDLVVEGGTTYTSGTWGTITANGTVASGDNTLTTTGNIVGSGTLNVSAMTLANNLTVGGSLGTSGTALANLSGPVTKISVAGDWNVTAFTENTGIVEFTTGASQIISGADTQFYTLSIAGGTLDGSTLTVNIRGNWSNSVGNGGFSQSGVGNVTFIDNTVTSQIVGNTTFNIFNCQTAGKTISFTAGSIQTIANLTTNGPILNSLTPTSRWTLNNVVASTISNTSVQDGEVTGSTIIAAGPTSSNLGNNDTVPTAYGGADDVYWTFGSEITTWQGDVDGDWNKAGNWNTDSIPTITNPVVIPNAGTAPTLSAIAYTQNLNISHSAVILTVAGFDLNIDGTLTNLGTIRRTGDVNENVTKSDNVNGTVEYVTGGASLRIEDYNATGINDYNNLLITADSYSLGADLDINGDLTVNDVLTTGGNSVTVGGDITGTGNLDASGMVSGTDKLVVTGSIGTGVTELAALSAVDVELGGNWNVTAFTPGTSTITFTGSVNYSLLDDSDIVFNNLIVADGTLSNDHIDGGSILTQDISAANLTLPLETSVLDTKGLGLTVTGTATGNGVISSTAGNTSLSTIDNTTTKLRATGTHGSLSAAASQIIHTASLASGTDALVITNIPGANALTIIGFDNGGSGTGGSLDLDGAVTTPNVYGKFNTLDLAVNAASGGNSTDIETGAGAGYLTSSAGDLVVEAGTTYTSGIWGSITANGTVITGDNDLGVTGNIIGSGTLNASGMSTAGIELTVGGSVGTSGTPLTNFSAPGTYVTIVGDWYVTNLTHNDGLVDFKGGDNSINTNNQTFNDIAKTTLGNANVVGLLITDNTATATGHITVTGGSIVLLDGAHIVDGDITGTGTFNAVNVTTGSVTVGGSVGTGTPLTSLLAPPNTLSVGANWNVTTLAHNNGLITFTGTTNGVTTNTQVFNNITKTSTGVLTVTGVLQTDNTAPASGHLTITAGSFILPNGAHIIDGDITGAGELDASLVTTGSVTVGGSVGTSTTALGTLIGPVATIAISGDWNVTTFTEGSSTVNFNGSATYELLDDSDIAFSNLIVTSGTLTNNHVAGGAIAAQNLSVGGNLTLTANTSTVDTLALDLTVTGDAAGPGVISSTAGGATLNTTSGVLRLRGIFTTVETADLQEIYTASINDVVESLEITSLTTNLGSTTIRGINIGGTTTQTGGSLDLGTTAVTPTTYGIFTNYIIAEDVVNGSQTVEIQNGSGAGYIVGSGGNLVLVAGSIKTRGTWTNITTGGTLTTGDYDLAITGNLNGGGHLDISGMAAGKILDIDGSIGNTTRLGTLTASGVAATTIYVGANWNVNAFTEGISTVVFDGGGAANIPSSSTDTTFYDLQINNDLALNKDISILRDISLNNIGTVLNGGVYTITVGRHWSNTVGNTGALSLTGAGNVTFNTIPTPNTMITGETTFNILNSTTPNKVIEFEAGSTQTIGTLNITPSVATSPITLKSTTDGTQWIIAGLIGSSVANVKVQDSDLTGSYVIVATDTNYNLGNNDIADSSMVPADFDDAKWQFGGRAMTWEGDVSNDWNIPGNWSGNSVPTIEDDITIPVRTLPNVYPTLSANAYSKTVDITDGNATLTTGGNSLIIANSLTSLGTVIRTGEEVITYSDNANGIVRYVGSGTPSIQNYGTLTTDIDYNILEIRNVFTYTTSDIIRIKETLTIDTGATLNLGEALHTGSNLTVENTSALGAGTHDVTVGGNLTSNGAITAGENTVTVTGNLAGAGSLTSTGTATTSNIVNVDGNWSIASYTGTGTYNIVNMRGDGKNITTATTFDTLSIPTGVTVGLTADIASDVAISGAGTLDGNTQTITVNGDWTITGFTYDTSRVDFNSATDKTIGSGAARAFYHLDKSNNSKLTMGGLLTVNGNLTIDAGSQIDLVGNNLNLYGYTKGVAAEINGTSGTAEIHIFSPGLVTKPITSTDSLAFTSNTGGSLDLQLIFEVPVRLDNADYNPVSNQGITVKQDFSDQAPNSNLIFSGNVSLEGAARSIVVAGNLTYGNNVFANTTTFTTQGADVSINRISSNGTSTGAGNYDISVTATGQLTDNNGAVLNFDASGGQVYIKAATVAAIDQTIETLVSLIDFDITGNSDLSLLQDGQDLTIDNSSVADGSLTVTTTSSGTINLNSLSVVDAANGLADDLIINSAGAIEYSGAASTWLVDSERINLIADAGIGLIQPLEINTGFLKVDNSSTTNALHHVNIDSNGAFGALTETELTLINTKNNFNMNLSSDLLSLVSITSTGSTVLDSAAGIKDGTPSPGEATLITAAAVDLGSTGGAIGGAGDDDIDISTTLLTDASANGDIFIAQIADQSLEVEASSSVTGNIAIVNSTAGVRDLSIDSTGGVTASNGTVTLQSTNGRIVAVNNTTDLEISADSISLTSSGATGVLNQELDINAINNTTGLSLTAAGARVNDRVGNLTLASLTASGDIRLTATDTNSQMSILDDLIAGSFYLNATDIFIPVTANYNITTTGSFTTDTGNRIYLYGGPTIGAGLHNVTVSVPGGMTLGDLYISLREDTLALTSNINLQNLVIYGGGISYSGTMGITRDMVILGSGYNDDDPDNGVADDNFAYNAINRSGTAATNATLLSGPIGVVPGFIEPLPVNGDYDGDFIQLTGSTFNISGNFYNNGGDMLSTGNWNLNIPDNNNATTAFAEAYNIANVQRAITNYSVAAAENVTVDGITTNWYTGRPVMDEAGSAIYTVYDDVIRVKLAGGLLFENTNDDIRTAVRSGLVGIFNGTITGTDLDTYTTAECTIGTTGQGDLGEFFIRVNTATPAYRWNTDATGTSAGTGTDRGRTGGVAAATRTTIPNLEILKSSNTIFASLRDQHKNRIEHRETGVSTLIDGVLDRCKPVITSVVASQHPGGTANTYDAHNYFEVTFSEDIKYLVNSGSSTSFPGNTRSSTIAYNTYGGALGNITQAGPNVDINGLFSYPGAFESGSFDGDNNTHAIETTGTRSIRIDVVGYKTGGIWPGYLGSTANNIDNYTKVSNPAFDFIFGDFNTDLGALQGAHANPDIVAQLTKVQRNIIVPLNNDIQDLSPQNNVLEHSVNGLNYSARFRDLYIEGTGWDVFPPYFGKQRIVGVPDQGVYEIYFLDQIVAVGNNVVDKVSIHILDNYIMYPFWDSWNGWNGGVPDPQKNVRPDPIGGVREDALNNYNAFTMGTLSSSIRVNSQLTGYVTSTDIIGFRDWTGSDYLINQSDDNYFSLTMDESQHWTLKDEMNIRYDAGTGRITDHAGNIMPNSNTTLNAFQWIPPEIDFTLGAVNEKTLYLQFSKNVYGNTPSGGSRVGIDAGSIRFTGLGSNSIANILALEGDPSVTTGKNEFYITLNEPLSANDMVAGQYEIDSSKVYDVYGTDVKTGFTRRVTDLGIGLVSPVYANDSIHSDDRLRSDQGSLREFDGTGRLMPEDIVIATRVEGDQNQTLPLKLLYDIDTNLSGAVDYVESDSVYNPDLWLPIPMVGVFQYDNLDIRTIEQNGTDNGLKLFPIPNDDPELKVGGVFDFIYKLEGVEDLYCVSIPTGGSYLTDLLPWKFNIQDIKRQRHGITILNNVINPLEGHKTELIVEIKKPGKLTINIITLEGTVIKNLHSGRVGAGEYRYLWDGTNKNGTPVARGIYFIKVVAKDIDETRKVLIVK